MNYKDIVEEVEFRNAEELFKELSVVGKYKFLFDRYIFRGQSDENHKLISSILRSDKLNILFDEEVKNKYIEKEVFENIHKEKEYELLCSFYEEADKRGLFVPEVEDIREIAINKEKKLMSDLEEEEWLSKKFEDLSALAQHYGLPTRLLDWSRDIYTALYFSVSTGTETSSSNKIVLWAFDIRKIYELNEEIIKINSQTEKRNENKKKYNLDVENNTDEFGAKKYYSTKNESLKDKTLKSNRALIKKNTNKIPLDIKELYLEILKYNNEIEKLNEEIINYNKEAMLLEKDIKLLMQLKNYPIPLKIVIPPYYFNQNLNAQSGILIYYKTKWKKNPENILLLKSEEKNKNKVENIVRDRIPLDKLIFECIKNLPEDILSEENKIFYKFTLPKSEEIKLLEKLHLLGYDGARLFPGYNGIKKKLDERRRIKINK
ncbi:FRG domain-containing protein [Fusobacterium varium]|uniref:FRG domain-containing protein n=1 Tax=Fusobacterium varium TaxID=856 RepID=UPI0022E7F7F6|nr:FRG domain-containing protein [Fusobacterium varium]